MYSNLVSKQPVAHFSMRSASAAAFNAPFTKADIQDSVQLAEQRQQAMLDEQLNNNAADIIDALNEPVPRPLVAGFIKQKPAQGMDLLTLIAGHNVTEHYLDGSRREFQISTQELLFDRFRLNVSKQIDPRWRDNKVALQKLQQAGLIDARPWDFVKTPDILDDQEGWQNIKCNLNDKFFSEKFWEGDLAGWIRPETQWVITPLGRHALRHFANS